MVVKVPTNLNSDIYLAAALAHGRPEAWALWHEKLELPIIRWLTRLPGGVRLGEELVLELAGDLFAGKLKEYRGESALRTWLTVVARNRLTDRLRSETRRGISLSHWKEGEPKNNKQELADEVSTRLDEAVLDALMKEQVSKLSEEEQKLIREYFFEGARMHALGKEYGINRTQIGRRLKNILLKLRARMSHGAEPRPALSRRPPLPEEKTEPAAHVASAAPEIPPVAIVEVLLPVPTCIEELAGEAEMAEPLATVILPPIKPPQTRRKFRANQPATKRPPKRMHRRLSSFEKLIELLDGLVIIEARGRSRKAIRRLVVRVTYS